LKTDLKSAFSSKLWSKTTALAEPSDQPRGVSDKKSFNKKLFELSQNFISIYYQFSRM
jgi:hypothetical protein